MLAGAGSWAPTISSSSRAICPGSSRWSAGWRGTSFAATRERNSSDGSVTPAYRDPQRMNPWHDIEIGDDLENRLPAIIEVPKDSKVKYELEKKTGIIRVDRVLFSSVHYPANYGFIP